MFDNYKRAHQDLATELEQISEGNYGADWKAALPSFGLEAKAMATREASGKILNSLALHLPTLIGGSADLAPSNNTFLKDLPEFQAGVYTGRNFHFGVREHAMGGILNGLALTDGIIPYGGTFLVFSDYMRPPIRMAALMGIRPIYVFTHDSIGLGEDGPTHQAVEHYAALRAIPGLLFIRPCDANETVWAWKVAIQNRHRPTALALTRQNVPTLDRSHFAPAEGLLKGAYVLNPQVQNPDIILMATGSEVQHIVAAEKTLAEKSVKVRLVSMPCWELFKEQSAEYREGVLPTSITARLAVEAGVSLGWHTWVGEKGATVTLDRYGGSAPGGVLMKQFGFTAENVAEKAMTVISRQ
jgi:transketolase